MVPGCGMLTGMGTLLTNLPDIPQGKGIPLVDLATDLFPQPTMDALDARYSASADLGGLIFRQMTQAEFDASTPASNQITYIIG